MPPKQVYGKRTKTPAAGYAKFLSPDKDILPSDNVKQKRKPETKQEVPNVVDLDRQLGSLTLKEEETARPETKKDVQKHTAVTKEDQTSPQNHVDIPLPRTPAQTSTPKEKRRVKPIPQTEMPLLPIPEPTPVPDDIYSAYVAPVLSISDLRKVVPFEQWSAELDPHFEVTKIAEASFSEVYRLTTKSGRPGFASESVLKVVALKSPPDAPLPSQLKAGDRTRKVVDSARQSKKERAAREKEDEWKSAVADVVSEVKLLQNLNDIPGFTHFCEVTVLQGRPSSLFAESWKSWNKSRPRGKKSEFPDPTKKTSYEDTQLWVVIEMQDAGIDLEKIMDAGGVNTIWEVWDVFWGVCLSVAKAEEACRFEHRDMHLENICIRSSRTVSDLQEPVILNPLKRKLGFSGLETTVIDYTLSRADIVSSSKADSRRTSSSSSTSCLSLSSTSSIANAKQASDIAYLDLDKSVGLFEGDAEDEYQYEIYRYMWGAVYHGDPLNQDPIEERTEPAIAPIDYTPETPRRSPRKAQNTTTPHTPSQPTNITTSSDVRTDIWRRFHPKTNLVWAHFIIYKLLEHLKGREPATLSRTDIMWNVRARPEDVQRVQKKATRLYSVLEKVSMMLDPEVLGKPRCLGSMKELVVMALEHRWLNVEDVAGGEVETG